MQATANRVDDIARFAKYAATVLSQGVDVTLFGSLNFVHGAFSQWQTVNPEQIYWLRITLDVALGEFSVAQLIKGIPSDVYLTGEMSHVRLSLSCANIVLIPH